MIEIKIKKFTVNRENSEITFIAFPVYPGGWPSTAITDSDNTNTVIFKIDPVTLIKASNNVIQWDEYLDHSIALFHERHWAERLLSNLDDGIEGQQYFDSF